MIAFKGRLSFLQYLPKKPHKWEMKAWVLADAQTGYTWGWKLYTGREGDRGDKGLAHGVVLELVDDEQLQDKGYVVVQTTFTQALHFSVTCSREDLGLVVQLGETGGGSP